jgi:transcriptional regulator
VHPAAAFAERDPVRLRALIAKRGLAMIVGAASEGLRVAHAPVLLDGDRLRFHLSAANVLCGTLSGGGPALALVNGPDAYISPDWYETPDQVPTWNYVSAEAAGPTRPLERAETIALLDGLSARFEAQLAPKPAWTREKLSSSTFERLLAGIVGFEMRIERLEGIAKLSQNKPADVIARVARQLAMRNEPGARDMAALIDG